MFFVDEFVNSVGKWYDWMIEKVWYFFENLMGEWSFFMWKCYKFDVFICGEVFFIFF